jgi:S-DNA-T family DNA segregation ATPase FtsK/SpoIIIE
VNAATITDFRRLADAPDEPRILVLVDGLTSFQAAYDSHAGQRWLDLFTSLAGDGRPVGVHFVVTADQRNGLWGGLSSAIQSRVVLRMATVDDYLSLDVAADVLSLNSAPGRAIVHGREVQIAVLGGSSDSTMQARAINGFAEGVRRAGVPQAPPILSLPESLSLSELPAVDASGRPAIGLSSTTMRPVGFDLRGSQIVLGPSGSGRTTAVLTMAQAALRAQPELRCWLFSPRRSVLTRATGLWTETAVGVDDCRALAKRLKDEVVEAGPGGASMLVVVERTQDFDGSMAEDELVELFKALINSEQCVVTEADSGFYNSNYGMAGSLKTSRSGLSLQPSGDEASAFAADYRGVSRDQLLEGRGFLVRRGNPELLQVALPLSTSATSGGGVGSPPH